MADLTYATRTDWRCTGSSTEKSQIWPPACILWLGVEPRQGIVRQDTPGLPPAPFAEDCGEEALLFSPHDSRYFSLRSSCPIASGPERRPAYRQECIDSRDQLQRPQRDPTRSKARYCGCNFLCGDQGCRVSRRND